MKYRASGKPPCSAARAFQRVQGQEPGEEQRGQQRGIGSGLVGLGDELFGDQEHKLAARLGSAATAGEGTQNYLCAAQAAAVLAGLAVTAAWPGGWWIDPVIGLGIAAVAVMEGTGSWRGDDCC